MRRLSPRVRSPSFGDTARLSPGPRWVNGAVGGVVSVEGRPRAVMGFTVSDGKIVEIDILADPGRVRELDLAFLH